MDIDEFSALICLIAIMMVGDILDTRIVRNLNSSCLVRVGMKLGVVY